MAPGFCEARLLRRQATDKLVLKGFSALAA